MGQNGKNWVILAYCDGPKGRHMSKFGGQVIVSLKVSKYYFSKVY